MAHAGEEQTEEEQTEEREAWQWSGFLAATDLSKRTWSAGRKACGKSAAAGGTPATSRSASASSQPKCFGKRQDGCTCSRAPASCRAREYRGARLRFCR